MSSIPWFEMLRTLSRSTQALAVVSLTPPAHIEADQLQALHLACCEKIEHVTGLGWRQADRLLTQVSGEDIPVWDTLLSAEQGLQVLSRVHRLAEAIDPGDLPLVPGNYLHFLRRECPHDVDAPLQLNGSSLEGDHLARDVQLWLYARKLQALGVQPISELRPYLSV